MGSWSRDYAEAKRYQSSFEDQWERGVIPAEPHRSEGLRALGWMMSQPPINQTPIFERPYDALTDDSYYTGEILPPRNRVTGLTVEEEIGA